jgi:hypothetical protein
MNAGYLAPDSASTWWTAGLEDPQHKDLRDVEDYTALIPPTPYQPEGREGYSTDGDFAEENKKAYKVVMAYVFNCNCEGSEVSKCKSDAESGPSLPVRVQFSDVLYSKSRPIVTPHKDALSGVGAEVGDGLEKGRLTKYRWYAVELDANEEPIGPYYLQAEVEPYSQHHFEISDRQLKTQEQIGKKANFCELERHEHLAYMKSLLRGAWKMAAFATVAMDDVGSGGLRNAGSTCSRCRSAGCPEAWNQICDGADNRELCAAKEEPIQKCVKASKKDAQKCLYTTEKQDLAQDPARISQEAFLFSLMAYIEDEGEDGSSAYKGMRDCFRQYGPYNDVAVMQLEHYSYRKRAMFENKDIKHHYERWSIQRRAAGEEAFELGKKLMKARGANGRRGLDRHAFVYSWLVANGVQVIVHKAFGYIDEVPNDDFFGPPSGTGTPYFVDRKGLLAKVRSRYLMYRYFADFKDPGKLKENRQVPDEKQWKTDYRYNVKIDGHKFVKFWLSKKAEKVRDADIDDYRKFLRRAHGVSEFGWLNQKKGGFLWLSTVKVPEMQGASFQYMSLMADEYPCEKFRMDDWKEDLNIAGVVQINKIPDVLQLLTNPLRDYPLDGVVPGETDDFSLPETPSVPERPPAFDHPARSEDSAEDAASTEAASSAGGDSYSASSSAASSGGDYDSSDS